jgi:hypothetical protein
VRGLDDRGDRHTRPERQPRRQRDPRWIPRRLVAEADGGRDEEPARRIACRTTDPKLNACQARKTSVTRNPMIVNASVSSAGMAQEQKRRTTS